jgi:hypothetical protein
MDREEGSKKVKETGRIIDKQRYRKKRVKQ